MTWDISIIPSLIELSLSKTRLKKASKPSTTSSDTSSELRAKLWARDDRSTSKSTSIWDYQGPFKFARWLVHELWALVKSSLKLLEKVHERQRARMGLPGPLQMSSLKLFDQSMSSELDVTRAFKAVTIDELRVKAWKGEFRTSLFSVKKI